MIWVTVSSKYCFGWLCRASLSAAAKSVWYVEPSLTLLEEVFAMTSVFSWQNSVSLYLASFCTPRPNLLVIPGISWVPAFAFQKDIFFFSVSSRRYYVFTEPIILSFFGISCWGINLDYCDVEWFALETNRDHYFLRLHPSTTFWIHLLTMRATPCLLRDSCPQ